MENDDLRVELIYFMIKNKLRKKDCTRRCGVSYHVLTKLLKDNKRPGVVDETRIRHMLEG